MDSENLEASIEALELSNIKDTICEVKLINLTTMQSIDINTADIKKVFHCAMYVNVKREFKTSSYTKTMNDIESLSLEDYFIEHIKEDSKSEDFDRLKMKVQELFSTYEEVYSDTE